MYMTSTESINVADARRQLAAIIDRARQEHEPVYLSRRGQKVAAVIDAEDLERLISLAEDMSDILAAAAARAEMEQTGSEPIPWEEVRAELGLS